MDIGKRSLLKGGMLTCKRNRSANRESLKPHRIPNPKTHWCFYENQMLKNGKFANCNERQNRKTEKFNPPSPPPHAFVYQIDYSTRGANISFFN